MTSRPRLLPTLVATVLSAGALVVLTPAPGSAALMTVNSFVSSYDGRAVDVDGAYGSQCVDLANLYNRKVVSGGSHRVVGNGRDWWTTNDSQVRRNYTHVSKTKVGRKGDIAVWNSSPGGYGHVAVVLSDRGSSLAVFTQTGGGRAHRGTLGNSYTWGGSTYRLSGYLRPRS